jgi:hypothetical protein
MIVSKYFVGGGLWRLLNINLFITSVRPLKSIFSLFWLYIWYHYVYIHNFCTFYDSHWRRTACTEFFSWFQCTQTVFKINTIIYRNISYLLMNFITWNEWGKDRKCLRQVEHMDPWSLSKNFISIRHGVSLSSRS